MGTVRRKSGYHHGSLRTALIDAAVELLTERGTRRFTLAEAAKRAGVSVAAPYRHFENKEALLAAVAAQGFERLRARLETAGAAEPDPVERMIVLGRVYIEFALEERAKFEVMFSLDDRVPTPVEGRSALDPLRETVEEVHASGRLEGDVVTTTHSAWALVHGVAVLRLGRMATFDDTTTVERVMRSFLTGVTKNPNQEYL
jgi:AcrR family transcriptional regulator